MIVTQDSLLSSSSIINSCIHTAVMSLRSDPINFEDFWPPIEKLLLNILNENYSCVSTAKWQDSFFDIYKVCVAQPDPLVGTLYSRLKTLLQHHVQELCRVSIL